MKILMAGLGGIGQRHVRNLLTLKGSNVEIIAYRVRNQSQVLTDQLAIESGSNLEEKYAIKVFTDLDQALYQKPDAVFICNPSSMHITVALLAAQAGCNLFIEKPLSNNYTHIEELVALIENNSLVAMVGYQMRFHPCLLRLNSLLQQKVIGRIIATRIEVGEYLPGWHTYEDYRQMYASRKELGGGVILSQIHEFDYIYWLFGLPKYLFTLGGHLSSLEIDVEDIASTLMECTVDGQPVPVHLHQDYVQRPPSRNCQVIGDEGKILVDFRTLTVQLFDHQGTLVETYSYSSFQRNQLFLDEMEHFLDCLEKKRTPSVTVRDGAQSLRMALASKESLSSGKIVALARDL